MGLKDWGAGFEELTEYYYRYAKKHGKDETWFVTSGVIGEKKSGSGSRSPTEIDLMAFLVNNTGCIKKIHAIQCKEGIKGVTQAEKVLQSYNVSTVNKLFRNSKNKTRKVVAYVEINDTAKRKLMQNRVELVDFIDMILELVDFFDKYNKQGRKGYEGEGIVWLLKRLRALYGMPSKDEIAKSITAEILDEKKKPKQDPRRVKAAKKAARTRKRNAAAKEKKRKAAARRRSGKKKR